MSLHPNTWYKWANDADYEDRRTNGLRQPPTYKNPDNKPGFKGDPEVEKRSFTTLNYQSFQAKVSSLFTSSFRLEVFTLPLLVLGTE